MGVRVDELVIINVVTDSGSDMKYVSYGAELLLKPMEAGAFANYKKSDSANRFEIRRQNGFGTYTGCCCCSFLSQPIPLYKYHDAPDFLHGNPFIIHGYRGKLPLVICVHR